MTMKITISLDEILYSLVSPSMFLQNILAFIKLHSISSTQYKSSTFIQLLELNGFLWIDLVTF